MRCVTFFFLLSIFFTPGMAARADDSTPPAGWFVFTMPGLDSSPTPIDLSGLNANPAGTDGYIRAKDGHLVDGRGRRVRFFATNLTATACFPEKDDAPRIAARLRKLGFNLVRLHFMDIDAPNGLFKGDMKTFDADQVDRLDFLVAELKKAGIYINLNLHVARRYPGLTDEAAMREHLGMVPLPQEYENAVVGRGGCAS